MSENQFHYGTEFTSVRVHNAPGGNSNFSLGWDVPDQHAKKPSEQTPYVRPPQELENNPPTLDEEEEERKR
jgi:hypothetical protein